MRSNRSFIIVFIVMCVVFLNSGCTRHVKPTPAQLNARMSIINDDKTETVFYLTPPRSGAKFPIAVLCDGSTTKDDVVSVWPFHQFDQFKHLPRSQLGKQPCKVSTWSKLLRFYPHISREKLRLSLASHCRNRIDETRYCDSIPRIQ